MANALPQTLPAYGRTARIFHWVIGPLIIIQLILGWWMVDLPKSPPGLRAGWFNFHKSIGITLAAFILLRLWWRLRHTPPELPDLLPPWQRRLARMTHAALYACMVIMPLSGYLGSSFTKYPIRYFGVVLPNWGWDWPAAKSFLSALHYASAWVFTILIAGHILAALFHLFRNDGIFLRMWPQRKPVHQHVYQKRA